MPTKQIICISLIANSNEELKIELMMDLQIFTRIMNINFIDEYVDIFIGDEIPVQLKRTDR
jgi:hypothetical protein